MKFRSKLIAAGLVIGLTFGLTACQGSTSETTASSGSASGTASTAVSSESIPDLEITIPLDDVTLPDSTSAAESESGNSEPGTSAAQATTPANGETDLSKVVALTFDDGPDTKDTSSSNRILDTLEQYGCKATFFVQGQAVQDWLPERNKATVKREADLGMEIGTHTYSHADLRKLTADEVSAELSKGASAITDVTGGEITLMRPPYGETSASTQSSIPYPMILWDVDTLDWQSKDPQSIYDITMEQIKGGSIVLMHDTMNTTADAVEMIVPKLVEEGYQLVTISELFRLYGVDLEPGYYYCNAREPGTTVSPFSGNTSGQ